MIFKNFKRPLLQKVINYCFANYVPGLQRILKASTVEGKRLPLGPLTFQQQFIVQQPLSGLEEERIQGQVTHLL